MIKVQNNTATREPIPVFLHGLAPESLADLSWTDPALGVADAAWWPEVDQSPVLAQYERYGDETLTVGEGVVIVTRAVVPFAQAEIDALATAKADEVRRQRNALLADWVDRMNPLVWETMTDEAKKDYRDFRQALLDVPDQPGFPWDVQWPETPSELAKKN